MPRRSQRAQKQGETFPRAARLVPASPCRRVFGLRVAIGAKAQESCPGLSIGPVAESRDAANLSAGRKALSEPQLPRATRSCRSDSMDRCGSGSSRDNSSRCCSRNRPATHDRDPSRARRPGVTAPSEAVMPTFRHDQALSAWLFAHELEPAEHRGPNPLPFASVATHRLLHTGHPLSLTEKRSWSALNRPR